MIGFVSCNPNRHQHQHHHVYRKSRRASNCLQVKLLGSLTALIIVLLGTAVALPTPSSVHLSNNREQRHSDASNFNGHYINNDNDQLLADLLLQLCGWTNNRNGSLSSLPVGVAINDGDSGSRGAGNSRYDKGNMKIRSSQEQQLLVDALQQLIQNNGLITNNNGNLASLTCEEEPIRTKLPKPEDKLASAESQTKLFLNTQNYDESSDSDTDAILANEEEPLLPFSNDENIQRQVIFVEIPEMKVNFHVHQPPPQTVVYVLPPKEEKHVYRIVDMRETDRRGKQVTPPPPSIHFLTNFGSNKIDTNNNGKTAQPFPGQVNLYQQQRQQQQSQSKSNLRRDQHQNRNQERLLFPSLKGVSPPPPEPASLMTPPSLSSIPALISNRLNQQPHFGGEINANSNSNIGNKNFEIAPAYNGYFYV